MGVEPIPGEPTPEGKGKEQKELFRLEITG